jgi:hypothetical protein
VGRHETIEAIRSAFGGDDPKNAREISRQQVLGWMHSGDIEVRGCIFAMICEYERARHIKPWLDLEDYYGFVIPYLEQCIEENPDGEWSHSRYLAGHALFNQIVHFWKDESVPRTKLASIKQQLAELYKRGDAGVRDAVVNAVLEHLFENSELADFFKDWLADPVLASAYRDALLWTTEADKIPILKAPLQRLRSHRPGPPGRTHG